MSTRALFTTLLGVIGGAVIGSAATLLVSQGYYRKEADAEIEKIRRHYALIRKDANTVTILGDIHNVWGEETELEADIETVPDRVQRILQENHYVVEAPIRENIFDKAVSEDEVGEEIASPSGNIQPSKKKKIVTGHEEIPLNDEDAYLASIGYARISGEPYVISQSEMFNGEPEWEKPTLSYYSGDDVLIDERNEMMDRGHRERYVGERHLQMFGVLSEDENIVYVRNPQISADFEIIREAGKYSVLILGEPDLESMVTRQKQLNSRASD